MFANSWVHYCPEVVFACLYITLPHYHHYADLSEGIELLKSLSVTLCVSNIKPILSIIFRAIWWYVYSAYPLYVHQWTGSAVVIACHLFVVKPLRAPKLTYFKIDFQEQHNSVWIKTLQLSECDDENSALCGNYGLRKENLNTRPPETQRSVDKAASDAHLRISRGWRVSGLFWVLHLFMRL